MTIAADIDSVKTEDAAPEEPPFKISDKPGKDSLSFDLTVTADDTIRAWRVRFNPTDRNHGKVIAKQGLICGPSDRCGPTARSLVAASPLERSEEIVEAEVHDNPDGDYPVMAFAREVPEWSD